MTAVRKKLIEVALPLDAINAEAVREKSIFKGHPSALHIWWSRKPLATARAVIWASLVDDPSSLPDQFPTPEAQDRERERLFDILKKLVVWENTNDRLVLEEARAEILKSTGGAPPALLDPFAGGGAIPLEARRLGLDAHARDLNPVAVMINKAMLELPARFAGMPPVNPGARDGANGQNEWAAANGLADDVEHYGAWMKARALERIGHLYPKVRDGEGKEYTVIAWIWARTVESPNPLSDGAHIPLASSLVLSTKKGNKAWAEIVGDPKAKDGWRFEVKTGDLLPSEEAAKKLGTKAGRASNYICCLTKSPVQRSYIQAEGKANRLSRRLMAIVAEGDGGRVYFSPSRDHEDTAAKEENSPNVRQARETFLGGATPTRAMITGGVCSAYGLRTWGHLFTDRQLAALTTFSDLVAEVKDQVVKDGGTEAYAQAVAVYLAFVVDKLADFQSSLCSWNTAATSVRSIFARQALSMTWDYAEVNPFSNSSGCFDNVLERVVKSIRHLPAGHANISAAQHDAQTDGGLRNVMVSTDPPYYDNIEYAVLSDFFYVWLRRSLKGHFPDVFATLLAPKAEELVASPFRFGGDKTKAKAFFEGGLLETFRQIYKYSRDDVPVTVYYAYKQTEGGEEGEGADDDDDEKDKKEKKGKESETQASTGWETMLSALIEAGFTVTGTWPMRTERAGRTMSIDANALASSIVIACRKRPKDAPPISRTDFIRALSSELGGALERLQAAGIAPTDFGQAAIGPGMAIYSRHSAVLDASGAAMGVRWALRTINQELDRYFAERDGGLDAASRLCVDLFAEYAYGGMEYGRAEVAARARNVSIDALAAAGAAESAKGKVRLLRPAEAHARKPKGPKGPRAVPAWAAMQRLIHALTAEDPITGEKRGGWDMAGAEAAELDAADGLVTERARALAYRMYQLADRMGLADEAAEFNQLASGWGRVQEKSRKIREARGRQATLGLDGGGG